MAFGIFGKKDHSDAQAVLDAASRSLAMIEFTLDGTIVTANENFLTVLGYTLDEIVGKHHRMFVDADEARSPAYAAFWDKLRAGQFQQAEFRRIAKDGRDVFIQASYNPVMGADGKPVKVVKFASDVTAQKMAAADTGGQLAAISKAQAVIEFNLDGTIITANQNFLDALGYSLGEIKGKHHRIFVEPDYARSEQYAAFWQKLGRGEYDAGEYLRIGRGGKNVWIQASYNPIMDLRGRPFKVVKYATDITARKAAVESIGAALGKLAEGDLTAHITETFPGELDEVRNAFNTSLDRFTDVIGRLRTSSGALRTATSEILAGANDLSERTTKQAAALEETSAAMEQFATTVGDNAKRAEEANTRAQNVSKTATEVGDVMHRSNEAMERISNSSSKISNIIGLIDDIAFQTNLLALNASVEAARAGEAGKGFAVVAVEVRRLAQSAAQASNEVKSLIEQSANEVTGGTRLVADATHKLSSMVDGVRSTADLVDAIAKATISQSSSISQMSTAIQEMDKMTQSNAALVEEINASIEQTEGQAHEMDKAVDMFIVAQSGPASVQQPKVVRTAPRPKAKASKAASSYLSEGSAALKQDWSEF